MHLPAVAVCLPVTARLVLLCLGVSLGGCASLGYYGHAASGQLDIIRARQSIEGLLASPSTDPALRAQLERVVAMRHFAVTSLQLPDSGSFRSYVELDRPHVMWNVFATPELSLAPKQWCYPFFGCLSYRSYFDERRAREDAGELERQGLDVYVGAVAAYSTIGWFRDPVYSTMLDDDDAGLAGVIFHELAHELLYVTDDTAFNESFAMTVQIEGVRRWLAASSKTADFAGYLKLQQYREDFVALVMASRARLAALYASAMTDEHKRREKRRLFSALVTAYRDTRDRRWQGYAGYDGWFRRELNNASLAPVGTYHQHVAFFQALLSGEAQGDLATFYRLARELGELPLLERRAVLSGVVGRASAAPE